MGSLLIVAQICADPFRHDHDERAVIHVPSNTPDGQVCPKRPEQTDCWDRRLGQAHGSVSSKLRTESSSHLELLWYISRQIHLRFHKLGLNFDDVLEIPSLAEFLHERKGSSNVLSRVAQEYSI
jgi:hypothetical protein